MNICFGNKSFMAMVTLKESRLRLWQKGSFTMLCVADNSQHIISQAYWQRSKVFVSNPFRNLQNPLAASCDVAKHRFSFSSYLSAIPSPATDLAASMWARIAMTRDWSWLQSKQSNWPKPFWVDDKSLCERTFGWQWDLFLTFKLKCKSITSRYWHF